MKKVLSFILLMIAFPMMMKAYIYTDAQGIEYELNSAKTAWKVTGIDIYFSPANITIPSTLKSLPPSLPDGLPVTEIGERALAYDYITSITLSDNLETIGRNAFFGSGITSIVIPKTVTSIQMDRNDWGFEPCSPFARCSNLTSITVDGGSQAYISPSGSNAIIDVRSGSPTLIVGCKTTQIPTTVQKIGNAAFQEVEGLDSISIPASVTEIGEGAFYGCSHLAAFQVNSSTPPTIVASALEGVLKYRLWVPSGSLSVYQSANVWQDFKSIARIGTSPIYKTDSYAYFDNSTRTLSFYYDNKYFSRGNGLLYFDVEYLHPDKSYRNWHYIAAQVNKVVFGPSFIKVNLTSTANWFDDMENLTEIEGLKYMNTSNVTTMNHMFYNCKSLKTVDVSSFNTQKVTNLSHFVRNCSSLTTLDLSNFNTSKVVNFEEMFKGCTSLTSLDISSFNTSNGEDMEEMFRNCSSLTTLDVSHFNTSNVEDFTFMFDGCSSLKTLDLSNFNLSNASGSHTTNMLRNCTSLRNLYISQTMNNLAVGGDKYDDDKGACDGIGTATSPCAIYAPAGFNFGSGVSTAGTFQWKDGWFVLGPTSETLTVGAAGIRTYCSDRDLDFSSVSGIKAYIAIRYETGGTHKVILLQVNDAPAGTGLVLVASSGSFTIPCAVSHTSCKGNLLKGTTEDITIQPTDGAFTNYLLYDVPSKGIAFYPFTKPYLLFANMAYLQLPVSTSGDIPGDPNGAGAVIFDFEDLPSGIANVRNVLSDDSYYTLSGIKVTRPSKGIYIHHGKKVVIK